jgi:hypothetical protein
MTDIFRTLIIPAANVELARSIAASFGPGGTNMWTTPLSATGAEPASHYISSGGIPAGFAHLVPLQTWVQEQDGTWVMTGSEPGDPVAVYNHCVEAGVVCTQADVDALFAAADVTEQEPFTAMERLGLQIIQSFDS